MRVQLRGGAGDAFDSIAVRADHMIMMVAFAPFVICLSVVNEERLNELSFGEFFQIAVNG